MVTTRVPWLWPRTLCLGGRLRHLRLKEHAVREHSKHKKVQVGYISTDQMIADTFIKALPRPLFEQHRLADASGGGESRLHYSC